MKRLLFTCAVAAPLALTLAACGGGEVIVQAQIEDAEGEAHPLPELEIRALPYDRDIVFDSLGNAYGTPEPEIPPAFQALQDSIAQAQAAYQSANDRWGTARDSLQKLSDRMRGMNPGSGAYVVAFNEFSDQEGIEASAKRAADQAFAQYNSLLARYNEQRTELETSRALWRDEAYREVDNVIALRLEELGREQHADTTGANGAVRFELPKGSWWIYARSDLPFSELYWNVPIEVEGGDPLTVTLNRANATERPKF